MLFQTYYRLDPWAFEPPVADFLPFRFDVTEHKFSLYVGYIHPRDEAHPPELLVYTLHLCHDVPHEVLEVFAGKCEIPLDPAGGDGFGGLPSRYREFILRTHADMDAMATKLFNVIRWRLGIGGGPLVLKSEWSSMRWCDGSADKVVVDDHGFLGRQVPANAFRIQLPETQEVSLGPEITEVIDDLFRVQAFQPLYHDIFREAWQNRRDNPRSALVMAVAAAETAFKTTAVDLCGTKSTEWIFENLPSPPLDRMIREYLELLPARQTFNGAVRRPPRSAIALLKESIELRNKLVHGRSPGVAPDRLDEILSAIRDFLYLMDFYRGHDWAVNRLTPEFAAAIRAQGS